MVLGLCRLLLRDPVEAEDAAQQVFVSAQRALLSGAVPREPAAWLAAIGRNECRARIRGRMREPLELPELPADIPDPLAMAIHAADLDALWAALSELPRRQRKAFLLRELGGLSYGELGVALGVTRPAVESLLFRARQQLRNALPTANAALVPVALRDQLLRLLPFGTPTGGAPFAAKAAAVTIGVGLGAVGVAELPKQHRHHVRTPPPAAAPVRRDSRDIALTPTPVSSVNGTEGQNTPGAQHGQRLEERQAENQAKEVQQRPERDVQVEAPEQEHGAPSTPTDESGNRGGDSSGDGGDAGAGDGGDSGGGGD
jgi:RNA polymerase sigma-70 factor (ECF subfamily)